MALSKEKLLRAYRQMKTIREFEERVNAEIMNGQIAGFTHLYTGQEANAVGVCEHLDDADTIISTHRGHGHCIAKGADVIGMMKELFGSSEGPVQGQGRLHARGRCRQGHPRRQRHRRRRTADLRGLRAGGQDSRQR